jgi:hypothetical protein
MLPKEQGQRASGDLMSINGHSINEGWMSPEEFTELCKSVFGPRWKSPASRVLGSPVRPYAIGENFVPPYIARQLRRIAHVEPAEQIVKQVVLRTLVSREMRGQPHKSPQECAHFMAKEIMAELVKAGVTRAFTNNS